MKISVNIITQNRPTSLQRLLRSLETAFYLDDPIPLTFNIDSLVDEPTLRSISSFPWPHGPKQVRRRIINGGLIRAVSESWYPSSDDDFGLLLEDDIELSPFFFLWLKYSLLSYHYYPSSPLPQLSSISLYTPRLVETLKERPKWNATSSFRRNPNSPYLHQLPCSWGALFFPAQWREFYAYMAARYTDDVRRKSVEIPKSRTNGWQGSWKKFLIEMMYLRGYVTLYPNFPEQTSFSTNHMEPGAHIGARGNVVGHRREDFVVPLMREDFAGMLPGGRMPAAGRLPVIDLFNRPATLKGLKMAGARLGQDVIGCGEMEVVVADWETGLPKNCSKI